jgi:predicted nucleic acid-binding protein
VKFWDASALVPLCLRESQSPLLRRVAANDGAMVVWWATPIECYSAFARLRRNDTLTRVLEEQARHIVTQLAADWTEIQPSHQVRDAAARALILHSLSAADALQLAAGLLWANGRPAHHDFVCLDQRLRDAAHAEGFQLLP